MARDIGRPHIIAARDSCRVKRERINAGIRNQNPGTIFLALKRTLHADSILSKIVNLRFGVCIYGLY